MSLTQTPEDKEGVPMKLNFGRRIVLFMHWLMSLAVCAMTVALILWPECREVAAAVLDDLPVLIYAIAMLVVYLLFSVGSISIIWSGRKRGGDNSFIVVDSSETGRTRIAVVAVEQMIRQALRGVDGIAQMSASIINGEDSISIDVDVAIVNGTHVPTVTMNIQRAIRSYIELNCGVAVRGVSVSVHSLTEPEEPGKRGRRKKTAVEYSEPQRVEPVHVPGHTEPTPVAKLPSMDPTEVEEEDAEEPDDVVEEFGAVEEETVVEEPAAEPEQKAEEPVIESAPAAEPQKAGFFRRFFGKRGEAQAKDAQSEAPAEEEQQDEQSVVAVEPEEEPAQEIEEEVFYAVDEDEAESYEEDGEESEDKAIEDAEPEDE